MAENAGAAGVILSADEVNALDQALDCMEMSAVFGERRPGKGARTNEGIAGKWKPP